MHPNISCLWACDHIWIFMTQQKTWCNRLKHVLHSMCCPVIQHTKQWHAYVQHSVTSYFLICIVCMLVLSMLQISMLHYMNTCVICYVVVCVGSNQIAHLHLFLCNCQCKYTSRCKGHIKRTLAGTTDLDTNMHYGKSSVLFWYQ